MLNKEQQMVAYLMQAKRYDVGDKLGYIEATIELALQRPDLQEQVKAYILSLIKQWDM
ncbi:UTP--glucose-1-phosphate uridylyltransferase [compost metagenome]